MVLLRLKQIRRGLSSPFTLVSLLILFVLGSQYSYLKHLASTNERLEQRLHEVANKQRCIPLTCLWLRRRTAMRIKHSATTIRHLKSSCGSGFVQQRVLTRRKLSRRR